MAESAPKPTPGNVSKSQAPAAAAPKPQGNPALRALGLPNLRLRLPSRNWLIFISITSSFAGALYYDRRQKRLTQQKWCDLVSHMAKEPLSVTSMPRRVTVYLQAPPGDGLRPAREHFTEYIKPILVAAAVDWDVIEGRREGEVRAGTADRVRRYRRRQGEAGGVQEDQVDKEELMYQTRERIGVKEWHNTQGHVVIGRHTWKEYVRGLHEGWLGPLTAPEMNAKSEDTRTPPVETLSQTEKEKPHKPDVPATADPDILITPEAKPLHDPLETHHSADQTSSDSSPDGKKEEPKKEEPPTPLVPPPHNTPESYSSSSLAQSIPPELPPSGPIPFPHILGFLNTPTRIYRFLTKRHLADEVGRATATAVLASFGPFEETSGPQITSGDSLESPAFGETSNDAKIWEQERELLHEEADWQKKARERTEGEGERVRLDNIAMDNRIASRMRRFRLQQDDAERADRLWAGTEKPRGRAEESDVD